jgi:predicted secreted hydrolase
MLAVALATVAAAPATAPPVLGPDGFRLAVPPYTFRFPADHAAHPSFRTEWWYYTGHLEAGARRFGYEVTFFRVGVARGAGSNPSAWRARDILFRHLALTDEQGRRFLSDDAAERAALDLAGADSTRYLVWLGDDYVGLEADRRTHRIVASREGLSLDLRLTPLKPPVVHGREGVSQKSAGEGNASHYVSITRLDTRGRLVLGRDTLAVAGSSWMDHEFASDRMQGTHSGWDWFSVQLDDGRDLMLYQLRRTDGRIEPYSSGTVVEADGASRHLPREAFEVRALSSWSSPRTGARYPSRWRLAVPGEGIDLLLEPTLEDQELVVGTMGGLTYWEGSVRVSGRSRGRAVAGRGYVELTGYTGRSPF